MDVSGEGWRMRPRDWRRVVENEAVRLVTMIGKIGNEDWRVILSNFLKQGGEGKDRE